MMKMIEMLNRAGLRAAPDLEFTFDEGGEPEDACVERLASGLIIRSLTSPTIASYLLGSFAKVTASDFGELLGAERLVRGEIVESVAAVARRHSHRVVNTCHLLYGFMQQRPLQCQLAFERIREIRNACEPLGSRRQRLLLSAALMAGNAKRAAGVQALIDAHQFSFDQVEARMSGYLTSTYFPYSAEELRRFRERRRDDAGDTAAACAFCAHLAFEESLGEDEAPGDENGPGQFF